MDFICNVIMYWKAPGAGNNNMKMLHQNRIRWTEYRAYRSRSASVKPRGESEWDGKYRIGDERKPCHRCCSFSKAAPLRDGRVAPGEVGFVANKMDIIGPVCRSVLCLFPENRRGGRCPRGAVPNTEIYRPLSNTNKFDGRLT